MSWTAEEVAGWHAFFALEQEEEERKKTVSAKDQFRKLAGV